MKYVADNLISRPMQFEEWKKGREETKNASTQNRVGASASDTAVPNGSGAKVIQNLEKAKNFYKNNANRARGFITDVARVNKNSRKLEINDIRSLHYRNDMNIENWINEDLADYIKPSFAEEWFEPMKNELRSKPQYNSADVRTQLVSAANKIKSFENPKQNGGNLRFRDNGSNAAAHPDETDNTLRGVAAKYGKIIGTSRYQTVEALQDSMRSLLEVQRILEERSSKPLEEWENAYMAENAMSSRNNAEYEAWKRDGYEPLKNAVRAYGKQGAEP